jgi:hypothetical protein
MTQAGFGELYRLDNEGSSNGIFLREIASRILRSIHGSV